MKKKSDTNTGENIITDEEVNNLRKIVHYIFDTYKDSCLYLNYKDNPSKLDEMNGMELLEQASDYYKYEHIGICGCGYPNSTIRKVVEYLEITEKWQNDIRESKNLFHDNTPGENRRKRIHDAFGVNDECDDPLVQFLAYIMDHCGFTEHGSSISGCWITDKGRACLYTLKLYLIKYDDIEEE